MPSQKNIIFIEPHFPLKMIPNPQSLSLEDDLIFQMTNNEIIENPMFEHVKTEV